MSSNTIINIADVARLMTIGEIEAFKIEFYDIQPFARPGQSQQGGL
jgi:hypothetical protein